MAFGLEKKIFIALAAATMAAAAFILLNPGIYSCGDYYPNSFLFLGCLDELQEIGGCPSDEQGRYDCIVAAALENRNPNLCEWIGARLNDACGQEYYEKAGDPSVCETVKPVGIRENCREYYSKRSN